MSQLTGGHRVGLVAGQEGDVDVLHGSHLRYVLGVACNIDAETVEGEDVAVVAPLGMELQVPISDVVGRNGFKGNVVGNRLAVAVLHRLSVAKHVGTTLVGDELGVFFGQLLDGIGAVVVLMLVGYEDIVGFGELGVVCLPVAEFQHGVYLYFLAVVLDADAGVHECMEHDGLAALGLERVCFVGVGCGCCGCLLVFALLATCRGEADGSQKDKENFLHCV